MVHQLLHISPYIFSRPKPFYLVHLLISSSSVGLHHFIYQVKFYLQERPLQGTDLKLHISGTDFIIQVVLNL